VKGFEGNWEILQKLKAVQHIGTCPEVLQMLLECKKQEPDVAKVADAIANDPTVAAQVLKVANCAYYARGSRIESVRHAAMHLGMQKVEKILYATQLIGQFRGSMADGVDFDYLTFWQNLLAKAYMTEALARRASYGMRDSAYLTALFRGLGLLFLRQYASDLFGAILQCCKSWCIPFEAACEKKVGLNDREIARLIAVRWNLPDGVARAFVPEAKDGASLEIRNCLAIAEYKVFIERFGLWDWYLRPARPDDAIMDQGLDDEKIEEIYSDAVFNVKAVIGNCLF
jgi:HD-like signal output (HDOD) protein